MNRAQKMEIERLFTRMIREKEMTVLACTLIGGAEFANHGEHKFIVLENLV